MAFNIPTQITGLLGTVNQALSDYNILDEDTAGRVNSALDIVNGSGQGLPTTPVNTTVPGQVVSPVSAEAKSELQKGIDSKTLMYIGGGVGFLVLLMILTR